MPERRRALYLRRLHVSSVTGLPGLPRVRPLGLPCYMWVPFMSCKAVLEAVASFSLTAFFALAIKCERATCRSGWYVNGVNPLGIYRCRPVLGDPEHDIEDARARRSFSDDREEVGYLYCTGGATPRHNGTRVWCDRP